MNMSDMTNEQFGFLFDVRRSIRYHDRRRAFFERMHQITAAMTVLLAGSVLFDIAKPGATPGWMLAIALVAALLSAVDMVVGYSTKAGMHLDLKRRFGVLEMAIVAGDAAPATWTAHMTTRLAIEQDEPPIYRALDLLCHNEVSAACGIDREKTPGAYSEVSAWQRTTRHLFHWADLHQA